MTAPSVTPLARLWLAISLPLVAWDTAYVLLRPHSMPGGSLHEPVFAPYALYGRVDHVYGFKAFDAHNGFTAAQGGLNLIETILYVVYLYLCRQRRGGAVSGANGASAGVGRSSAAAELGLLLGFTAAVMTLSKTVLYWLNEYFSGFDNIGHNTPTDLFFLWIIPNGAWLIFPAYMIYSLGSDILARLMAAEHSKIGDIDGLKKDK